MLKKLQLILPEPKHGRLWGMLVSMLNSYSLSKINTPRNASLQGKRSRSVLWEWKRQIWISFQSRHSARTQRLQQKIDASFQNWGLVWVDVPTWMVPDEITWPGKCPNWDVLARQKNGEEQTMAYYLSPDWSRCFFHGMGTLLVCDPHGSNDKIFDQCGA